MSLVQTGAKKMWGYRHVILIVLWLVYIINYFDRISVLTFLPLIRADLDLSHEQIGFAASIFFFAYAVAQVSAGYLADKIGSKRVMYLAIVVFTAVTFVTGLVRNYTQFILLRLGLGLGEGHHFSPANKTISDWFPKSEKGRATAFFSTTWAFAPAIIPVLITYIAAAMGGSWREIFFVLAIPGLVGIAILWYFVSDKPEEMLAKGRLSQEEYDYIKAGLVTADEDNVKKLGIGVIIKDPSLWLYSLQLFCLLAIYWGSTSWISSFLFEQHGFSLKTMGLLASLPYAVAIISTMLGGTLMDKVFHRTKPVALISFLAAIPILIYMGQIPKGSTNLLILMLILNGFFVNMVWGVIYAYPQMRYPKEVIGSAVGLTNGLGQLGAFISPLAAGYLVHKTAAGISYDNVFLMFAGFAAVAALVTFFLKEEPFVIKEDDGNKQEASASL
ncbi:MULTISPECIES: MFS transporter [Sporomusa]|jgi:sugar phosphate permease|uniref:Major facilitator superfamily MFS_1 n=1 Tax=uncultured Sporomusa sp. TaxID=307249 RepID=A0A212LVR1_9FIRM|nr:MULTISPECIES: MFS transporter [Sporomusa]MCM0761060.1 MFS transporter [Sporomusa sphaeroides DSM 2875]SCM81499.1 Major facilitator superfamily MFS_1 [uncultured Sporomusa sp.]